MSRDRSPARPEPGAVPDESDLCVACGMCCDGTFLSWAPVVPGDDLVGLRAVGHPVSSAEPHGPHFTLPCPALIDRCCTVYGHRPSICHTYRCRLLDRYGRGDVDRAEALAVIESTVELRDRVRSALAERLGEASHGPLADSYAALIALHDRSVDPGAARRRDAGLLLDIVALRRRISGEFDAGDAEEQSVEVSVSRR